MSHLSIHNLPRTNLEMMVGGNFTLKPEEEIPLSPELPTSTQETLPQTNPNHYHDYRKTTGCLIVIISSVAIGILYGNYLHPGAYSIMLVGVVPLYVLLYHCNKSPSIPRVDGEDPEPEAKVPTVLEPLPGEDIEEILQSVTEYLIQEREHIITQVDKKMSSGFMAPVLDRLTPKGYEEVVLRENPDYETLIDLATKAKTAVLKLDSEASTAFVSACAAICGSDEAKIKRVVCYHEWSQSYSPVIKEASYHPYTSVVMQRETDITDHMYLSFRGAYKSPVKPKNKIVWH